MRTQSLAAAVLCAAMPSAAGCAASSSGTTAPAATHTVTQPAAAPVTVPAAAAAGRRYLTVARTWTPDTYLEQWRIQVRLSGGDLRAALRSARPTRAQLAQLQTDQSNATASVVAVTPISESGRSAKYRIVIAEQTVVAGVQQQEQTVNEVVVRRVDDRWAVTNATVVP